MKIEVIATTDGALFVVGCHACGRMVEAHDGVLAWTGRDLRSGDLGSDDPVAVHRRCSLDGVTGPGFVLTAPLSALLTGQVVFLTPRRIGPLGLGPA